MIQRLQSLLLLLAAIANVVVLFVVLGDVSDNNSMEGGTAVLRGAKINVSAFNESEMKWIARDITISENPLLLAHVLLVVASSLILFASIFLYSNRMRQAMVVTVGLVSVLLQIVVMVLLFQQLPDLLAEPTLETHHVGFWMIIPVVVVLLAFFARKRIQKDEKLVRDMDRIR
jgi:hypothetical protein